MSATDTQAVTLRESIIETETRLNAAAVGCKALGVEMPNAAEVRRLYEESLAKHQLESTDESWYLFMSGVTEGMVQGTRVLQKATEIDIHRSTFRRRHAPREFSNLWGLLPR